MKKITLAFFGLFLSLLGVDSQAATMFDSLTTGIDLSAISTAMTTVFAGMVGVGIFMKGGSIIA